MYGTLKTQNVYTKRNEFAQKFLLLIAYAIILATSTWHFLDDKYKLFTIATHRILVCLSSFKYESQGSARILSSCTAGCFKGVFFQSLEWFFFASTAWAPQCSAASWIILIPTYIFCKSIWNRGNWDGGGSPRHWRVWNMSQMLANCPLCKVLATIHSQSSLRNCLPRNSITGLSIIHALGTKDTDSDPGSLTFEIHSSLVNCN